jgi:hypothetical protein
MFFVCLSLSVALDAVLYQNYSLNLAIQNRKQFVTKYEACR